MQLMFWRKAKPERRESDRPVETIFTSRGERAVITYPEQIEAAKALLHPVLFRVVNKIAISVQSVKWYAEEDPDVPVNERASKSSIKKINSALGSPNDYMTAEQLRYWMGLNFALNARVNFKVGLGIDNLANGIYPLNPAATTRVLNDKGFTAGYKYGTGEKAERYPTRAISDRAPGTMKPAYVSEIYTPSLDGSMENWKSNSPLTSLHLPAQVVSLLLRRAIDTASGHPNTRYVVVAEKTLTDKQKVALREQLENSGAGDEDSGKVLMLYNTKVEIHKLDNDLSDIHSKMPMDDMTRMIAGAYGVPIALLGLGASDGAKFAGNYIESRQAFWEDTIVPGYLSPIAGGMTSAIAIDGMRIVFDLDSVPALQDSRVARAVKLSPVNFLDQNEKRELCGYLPSDKVITLPPAATTPNTPSNTSDNPRTDE